MTGRISLPALRAIANDVATYYDGEPAQAILLLVDVLEAAHTFARTSGGGSRELEDALAIFDFGEDA